MLQLFSQHHLILTSHYMTYLGGRNENGIQLITIQCNTCYRCLKVAWATPSDTRSLKIINTKIVLEESLENFIYNL